MPRAQGFNGVRASFFEAPLEDPNHLEIWCYTDRASYRPGETVEFRHSTTAKMFSLEIYRDGAEREIIYTADDIPGELHRTPHDFYREGCNWPVSHCWTVPDDLPSGFYVVVSRAELDVPGLAGSISSSAPGLQAGAGQTRQQEHGFFVLPKRDAEKRDILFLSSICTWTAYNDWGGLNSYTAYNEPNGLPIAPELSLKRPWARGFIDLPVGAPRKQHQTPPEPNAMPFYPSLEFAFLYGLSRFYSSAGWASYEAPFVRWAERNGYQMDFATQLDIHADPALLENYKCVAIVGHCEYWSWEMRDAIDRYVDSGGHIARFAGNFAWQIRVEDDGARQVCYKESARQFDPAMGEADQSRLTSVWEDPLVGRPGTDTFGLNSMYGIYAHVGSNTPRCPGGFTVYRPDHWALEGSGLFYGDVFGGEAKIFGYEVDGLDYTMKDGVPLPTERAGAWDSTEIIAMGLASNIEEDRGQLEAALYYGDTSAMVGLVRYGEISERSAAAGGRGSGMMISFNRGEGSVFHAGTTDWVAGLEKGDPYTETITKNVLNKFCSL